MSVKVYSTPTCPWCDKAKQYLSAKGVAYENINVAEDRDAAIEMVRETQQRGVPVIKIGERWIIGYSESEIDEALKEAGAA